MGASTAQASTVQRQGTIAFLGAILMYLSLSGCAHLGWSKTDRGVQPLAIATNTVTIAAIRQAPNVNAIVQLKGKVGNHAPLLGKTAYELQDTTGSIWVLTTEPSPKAGDEVVIQGKLLYQSILINGKEQGSAYIEQQQRVGGTR